MPYTLFLYFTGVFVCVGMVIGVVLLFIANRHQVALRSLLLPLGSRHRRPLLRRVALTGNPPSADTTAS